MRLSCVLPQYAILTATTIPLDYQSSCSTFKSIFFPAQINHATFIGNWNDTHQTYLQQYLIADKFYKLVNPTSF